MFYGRSVSEPLGYKRPHHSQKMKSGEERNKYTQSSADTGVFFFFFVILNSDIQISLFHSAEDYNIRSTCLRENNNSKCIILTVIIQ